MTSPSKIKNIERWGLFFPENAALLKGIVCDHTFFITNPNGTLNLVQKIDGEELHFHSDDPQKEAEEWFQALNLVRVDVIFIYGIGLGYYYEAAQKWLQANENRRLIFIEDDLEVIARYFETPQAEKLLHDEQICLQYVDRTNTADETWEALTSFFSGHEFIVTALKAYFSAYAEFYNKVSAVISFWANMNNAIASEYLDQGKSFLSNFYQNIFHLPKAYQASALYGKFTGTPAIICGAGPSIDKNLDLLEKLGDRALIFSGGTAMNTVNVHGFWPHFGIGIDPNISQLSRLLMNTAFEVPFLYRNRTNFMALNLVQSNLCYVTGSGGYHIANWFEKELGIEGKDVEEGYNVINFSLALACAFGCNPIIFVGVDLAYSEKRSYGQGLLPHPIFGKQRNFLTKNPHEELLYGNDIYGKPVPTLWKWVSESSWYSNFADRHPHVLFINSTEGGLGMTGIPNKPLREVSEYLLGQQFDLRARLHGEIQNAAMPSQVTEEAIFKLLIRFKDSLQTCCKILQEIEQLSDQESIDVLEEKLSKEVAYENLLNVFNEFYLRKTRWETLQLEHNNALNEQERKAKKIQNNAKKCAFLKNTAISSIVLIELSIKRRELEKILFSKKESSSERFLSGNALPEEEYSVTEKKFIIKDPESDLHLEEKIHSESFQNGNGRHIQFYASGAPKMEQFYQNWLLHGPATFYNENGKILAQSWYVNGKQQGKARYFYQSGELYGIERFRNGLHHGKQEYYFQNGSVKSLLNYFEGQLHGEVLLYYVNGMKKRESHFEFGMRHGVDRYWNEAGRLALEAEFFHNRPYGTAREWEVDKLVKEIVYDVNFLPSSIRMWDANGKPLPEDQIRKEDYFDAVTRHTDLLTQSLDNVSDQLYHIAPFFMSKPSNETSAIRDDMAKLKEEIEHLHKMNKELFFESGLHADNLLEPIWKTPSSRKIVEHQLSDLNAKLVEDLNHIQRLLEEFEEKGKIDEDDRKK